MEPSEYKKDVERLIRDVPSRSARERLTTELLDLLDQRGIATDEQKPLVEARMAQLRRDTQIASAVSPWSVASMVLIGFVTFIYFLSIILYMAGLGPGRYSGMSETRPIIVFTLIIAMLGFGGLLIVRGLFHDEEDQAFQNRFRHSREIFLVFSGIFGTIIGFYFGAADGEGPGTSEAPAIEIAALADRKIEVKVTGGQEPFLGFLELKDGVGGAALAANGRTLSTELAAEQCPAEASVTVVDGRGKRVEGSIDEAAAALQGLGWTCPATATAATPASEEE